MSPVTTTACGRSRASARTAASSTWVENASCGRKVEVSGAPMRSRNGTRAGDSSSRTWTSESWPKVASTRPPAGPLSGSPGPRSRNPSPSRSTTVASSVDVAGGALAAPPPQPASARTARARAARLIPRAGRRRPALGGRGGPRARSRRRRARAGRRRRARPGRPSGAIGSDAKPAARRATSGPSTAASSATPSSAPGSATAAAAPSSTSATVGPSPPHARSSATAPRRSRAVMASAWTSA